MVNPFGIGSYREGINWPLEQLWNRSYVIFHYFSIFFTFPLTKLFT
ncbi:hypothetical protein TREAZ_1485 [Leadbettera azotonutricia ZAS-9]|uniref:Uncharacterized protein n=1 Tax=Leadbettera azotonutricia (strain ATCC BAA-888 / DSM 13862 / ZAS-9) TaxID=545695 RepID=F5YEM5_LEAAZ|nr:hypothetical protein TREAZ_1485 [Leadbettera azotonutricia ZAS-9]